MVSRRSEAVRRRKCGLVHLGAGRGTQPRPGGGVLAGAGSAWRMQCQAWRFQVPATPILQRRWQSHRKAWLQGRRPEATGEPGPPRAAAELGREPTWGPPLTLVT